MATVISCVIEKGGTGKSTTVLNLAALMGMDGKKVLVVDVDQQANITYLLTGKYKADNAFRGTGLVNLLSNYDDGMNIHPYIHETKVKNVDILPSTAQTPRAIGQLGILAEEFSRKEYTFIMEALSTVADEYDYILFDTPPARDVLTLSALYCADEVIIPARCDRLSIEGLETTMNMINELSNREQIDIHVLGILLTQTERTSVVNIIRHELANGDFSDILFKTDIRKGSAVSESTLLAESVVQYNKSSNPAKDYINLYKEIKERLAARGEN